MEVNFADQAVEVLMRWEKTREDITELDEIAMLVGDKNGCE